MNYVNDFILRYMGDHPGWAERHGITNTILGARAAAMADVQYIIADDTEEE